MSCVRVPRAHVETLCHACDPQTDTFLHAIRRLSICCSMGQVPKRQKLVDSLVGENQGTDRDVYREMRLFIGYAAHVIDNIYEYFNIDIKYRNDQLIKSACPVHGGDNPVACNFYPAGDHVVHWKCRKHN